MKNMIGIIKTTKEDINMKRQIRKGVFETNSSSTHSITMMMKSDYDRWSKEKLYFFDGYTFGWEDFTAPKRIEFLKKNKYYKNESVIDDDMLREADFILADDEGSEYLEGYYEEFTTPSGETIVAFGEYGYDG